jgi:sugar O-acyltransferase (sialic acid O-acetyltransferase NeuD family)
MKNIVVIGASGQARVVIDICRRQGLYEVVGLLDSYKPLGTICSGCQVIGTCSDLPAVLASGDLWGGIVAIGDNWTRARKAAEIGRLLPDFRFVSAIHPSAQIAEDAVIGPGSAVMAGAIVNPGSRTGAFCILNTRCSVDHDCVLDDYASLGPGAVLGGGVRVGAYSAIGIGAVVLQEVHIGSQTVVGAASTVLKHVPDNVVAYGTPARVIRPRHPGDRYL